MTNNLRQWEQQMRWKRQGRSWIEPPTSQSSTLPSNSMVKLRPLGNSLSSGEYFQPFMIWSVFKIKERFGLDD